MELAFTQLPGCCLVQLVSIVVQLDVTGLHSKAIVCGASCCARALVCVRGTKAVCIRKIIRSTQADLLFRTF
jgi:hypothetical protein